MRLMRSTWLLALALPLIAGCASTTVKRMDVDSTKDLSGRWNDTDSRLVAQSMIQDCLSEPWLQNAEQAKGGKAPTVIVGHVRNKSDEHIDTDSFIEDLQQALINSQKVEFVASKNERAGVRDERLDQDTNSSEDTRKANGQETGADFMLTGEISTISDQEGGESVVLYQVNLKLINMETNQIAWNGGKKIKKDVTHASVGW